MGNHVAGHGQYEYTDKKDEKDSDSDFNDEDDDPVMKQLREQRMM